ncbi:MAG: hypothetical protein AAGA56_07785 [Myxococcota bacterium]
MRPFFRLVFPSAFLALATAAVGCGDDDSSGVTPDDDDRDPIASDCGNGQLDAGEACDGEDLGDATCAGEGFSGGELGCTASCQLDTSSCSDTCGDGTAEGGEQCDGADLAGISCATVPGGNFTGGIIACASDCTFDTSQCTSGPGGLDCGNGVRDDGEDCDGADLGGADCTTVPGDFASGTLGCTADCSFDTAACVQDAIGVVKGSNAGVNLQLPVNEAIVTYIKPAVGDDPAGFFVQSKDSAEGPAIFIAVAADSLTPNVAVGDELSFTVDDLMVVEEQRRVSRISALSVDAQGADTSALARNISAEATVVIEDSESELITVAGTVVEDFRGAAPGHRAADIDTAGSTGDSNLRLRLTEEVLEASALRNGCTFTVTEVPLWRFRSVAQVSAWAEADIVANTCPAPELVDVRATAANTIEIEFDAPLDPATLESDGRQFTFDVAGLTATAAVLNGNVVTVTTTAQPAGAAIEVTVDATLLDTFGAPVDSASNSLSFNGFTTPATVLIHEVNANISSGCDLIELRVTGAGSMDGFELRERTSVVLTFGALQVQTDDIIVVHFNASNAACGRNGAVDETTSVTEQAAATFSANYDTAYDWWSADSGLTRTDNVFTLYDDVGTIIDALFASDDNGNTAAGTTETQAAVVSAAGQWFALDGTSPVFEDQVFLDASVLDLDGTGTSATGSSIQRSNDMDTNRSTGWTQTNSSWGLLNTGQTASN